MSHREEGLGHGEASGGGLQRIANAGGAESGLVDASILAAGRKCTVYGHGGHGLYAERLGPTGPRFLLERHDLHVAGRTGHPANLSDDVVTKRTIGGEHLYGSGIGHESVRTMNDKRTSSHGL